MSEDGKAPEGTIWICPACGKSARDRYGAWDVSCAMWAVLCVESSVERDTTGRIVRAEAMPSVEEVLTDDAAGGR